MNDSSVTRTASDALQAKASAVCNVGYRLNVPGGQTYAALLQQALDGSAKRQTPLVHAGYVLRIQAILSMVNKFVDYHGNKDIVQIILLGGGMDVTGLWAGHVSSSQNCRVIEIDLPTVCATKHNILQQKGLIHFHDDDSARPNVAQGTFPDHPSRQYALVELDLREDSIEWGSVLDGLWDNQSPTLVVSEVVLAYVGHEATDRVLSSWATAMAHPESCLVLLEPLGPNMETDSPTNGIIQSYQKAYTQMFHAKLERGTTKGPASDHGVLAPVGSSPRNVARRLRKAGWAAVVSVSLASASSNLQAMEPFDEHAALLLHAQSYVVTCAFLSPTTDTLFRRVLAPWQSNVPPIRVNEDLWIATIDQTEEATVKGLFVDGYADLTRISKSVHKLVQGTFKKDLIFTPMDTDGIDFSSHFAKYYENRGGCFLVAITPRVKQQQIVGFVAVSKAPEKAQGILAKHANTFEIHRLLVVPEYRSQGVAGHLLDAVQRFCFARVSPGDTVTFVATTLNVLKAASRLYERRGFVFVEEEHLTDIILRHYMLRIPSPVTASFT